MMNGGYENKALKHLKLSVEAAKEEMDRSGSGIEQEIAKLPASERLKMATLLKRIKASKNEAEALSAYRDLMNIINGKG